MSRRIVLASRSPRRRELLAAAGLEVTVIGTHVDERARAGESAVECARRLCSAKLEHSRAHAPSTLERDVWLAADTVVWFPPDLAAVGKPADAAEARRIIGRLTTGRPHRVTTAFALAGSGRTPSIEHATTHVHMRPLQPREVDAYLNGDEWRDKAGGYGIQGAAASWVTHLEGSYTNVVGLPVAQVILALERLGEGL